MQKTLDILERNVQWFALGLGGILLLWAVYQYVITPPAAVKVGTRQYTAGELAPLTADEVNKLKQQIAAETTPSMPNVDVVRPFQLAMSAPLEKPVNAYVFNSPTGGWIEGREPGGKENGANQKPRLAALPELPAAQPVSQTSGLSVVNMASGPNANGNAPPGRGGPAQLTAANTQDVDWVTTAWKVPADAIKKAFEAPLGGRALDPNIAPMYKTAFLRVVLQRQRAIGMNNSGQPVFPQGDSGIETVGVLKIYKSEMQPMPAPNGSAPEKYKYLDWAEKNPDLIYQPQFYTVVAGDNPWDPAQLENIAGGQNGATGGSDSGQGTSPDNNATQPSGTTPDATPPQTQPSQAPPSQPQSALPAAGRAAVARSYLAEDDQRPNNQYDPRAEYRRRYGGNNPRYDSRFNPRAPFLNRGQMGRPMIGPQGNAAQGEIDPLEPQGDLKFWAHDDSVKSGQTYRYRVVYYLKNPIFGIQGLADPKLTDQLAIASPPSDWTDPIMAPEKTKFWIASLNRDNTQARMDVFVWKDGKWKADRAKPLAPGDVVPGTDWTVVDIRGNDRDRYVLLTNDDGEMSKRDLNTDKSDQKYKDMLDSLTKPQDETQQPRQQPSGRPILPRGRYPGGRPYPGAGRR